MIYDLLAGNAKIKIKEKGRTLMWSIDQSMKKYNTIYSKEMLYSSVERTSPMNSISNRELGSAEYIFKGVKYKVNIKID